MDHTSTQAYIAQLERKVQNLTKLVEVNGLLNNVLLRTDVNTDAVLSYMMDTAADLTESQGAAVLMWNETKQELRFTATNSSNRSAQSLIGKLVPTNSIAGYVVQEQRPIMVNDVSADPRHYGKLDAEIEFVTRSVLGVPLISNQRVVGVLEVVNKQKPPWTPADRSNLMLLAGQASIVIEVAQLLINLQHAYSELSELDKLKSDFIGIASHELRTPLGIILGYASFLQEDPDSTVRSQASKVVESALQLRRIIESMVNLRYIQQKSSDLKLELHSLSVLIEDLRQDVTDLAQAGKCHFVFNCRDQSTDVLVDRIRIGMALMNIVNNAISFSPVDGTITIEAYVRSAREAIIRIHDQGIGIEPLEINNIFEEFYQVEDHMVRKHGGLGIGLSISRAVIQAHGGTIWAESAGVGHGATFNVTLPLVRPDGME
jgi:signal transduction histidine kinase